MVLDFQLAQARPSSQNLATFYKRIEETWRRRSQRPLVVVSSARDTQSGMLKRADFVRTLPHLWTNVDVLIDATEQEAAVEQLQHRYNLTPSHVAASTSSHLPTSIFPNARDEYARSGPHDRSAGGEFNIDGTGDSGSYIHMQGMQAPPEPYSNSYRADCRPREPTGGSRDSMVTSSRQEVIEGPRDVVSGGPPSHPSWEVDDTERELGNADWERRRESQRSHKEQQRSVGTGSAHGGERIRGAASRSSVTDVNPGNGTVVTGRASQGTLIRGRTDPRQDVNRAPEKLRQIDEQQRAPPARIVDVPLAADIVVDTNNVKEVTEPKQPVNQQQQAYLRGEKSLPAGNAQTTELMRAKVDGAVRIESTSTDGEGARASEDASAGDSNEFSAAAKLRQIFMSGRINTLPHIPDLTYNDLGKLKDKPYCALLFVADTQQRALYGAILEPLAQVLKDSVRFFTVLPKRYDTQWIKPPGDSWPHLLILDHVKRGRASYEGDLLDSQKVHGFITVITGNGTTEGLQLRSSGRAGSITACSSQAVEPTGSALMLSNITIDNQKHSPAEVDFGDSAEGCDRNGSGFSPKSGSLDAESVDGRKGGVSGKSQCTEPNEFEKGSDDDDGTGSDDDGTVSDDDGTGSDDDEMVGVSTMNQRPEQNESLVDKVTELSSDFMRRQLKYTDDILQEVRMLRGASDLSRTLDKSFSS